MKSINQNKRHKYLAAAVFGCIALFSASLCSANKEAALKLPDTFPISMTFHAFNGAKFGSPAGKKVFEEQAPYSLIHGPRPDEVVALLHARWPEKIITLQAAYGGVNSPLFPKVWPGHLLYKTGTLLTEDISSTDMFISVANKNQIAKNNAQIEKTTRKIPFSVVIYAIDESGKPDWSQAEHVVIESMNQKGFVVKRGQWGSKPLSFKAGKAVVASHMMFWSGQWQLNFSLHSPRGGADNLTAAEWFARQIAQRVTNAKADGVEFDVARWIFGNPVNNSMDINNDLIPDYGYIDGVNSFGLGGQVFFRELRRLLGSNKIIQADSNNAISGVRGWKYLNGVQLESFPSANDFDRFSQSFLHLQMWVKNAEAQPQISYPFTKTATTIFSQDYLPNGSPTDFRFRVGFAAACLLGMPHPFAGLSSIDFDPENPSLNNKKKEKKGVFNWDEYHGGDLNNWHWLGKPVADAVQNLTGLSKTDKLAKANWQWSVAKEFTAKHSDAKNEFSATVETIPASVFPATLQNGVSLAPKNAEQIEVVPGHEYTIEFEAKGDDVWQYAGQSFERVPRMLTINGAVSTEKNAQPLSVLVDSQWRSFRISFVADATHAVTPVFGVSEQIGTTQIRNIKMYDGGGERWMREFENGLVLLNMTGNPWTVELPEDKYKRLKGKQVPEINSGEMIKHQVVIPANDALFLTKTSASIKPKI